MKANDLKYLIVQHAPSLNPQLAISWLHVVSRGITHIQYLYLNLVKTQFCIILRFIPFPY